MLAVVLLGVAGREEVAGEWEGSLSVVPGEVPAVGRTSAHLLARLVARGMRLHSGGAI